MPLGSVDSEDGNGLVDDELHTLLPGTREVSADDLSQVCNQIEKKIRLEQLFRRTLHVTPFIKY